jgi:GNAT superfamily N-acetyltransferase
MTMQTTIRAATAADVPVILDFIKGLADYEKLRDEVTATEEVLREELFGPRAVSEVILAYAGETPVGFALFFHNFSTFVGRRGLYLEDLYVLPAWRGMGVGRQLLAFLARVAVERKCGRFEWTVLDWNEPAIRFYRSVGARSMDGWTIFRIAGDALDRLAGESPSQTVK